MNMFKNSAQTLNETPPTYEQLLASMSAPDTPHQERLLAMFYGESGKGKTILAISTIVAINKAMGLNKGVILIETGSGGISLHNHPDLIPYVRRIQYESLEQIVTIGRLIREGAGEFEYYNGIVIDEYSSVARMETDRVHQERIRLDLLQQSERNDKAELNVTPTWPTYNATAVRMRRMLDDLSKANNLHIVLTCHEGYDKNKSAEIVKIKPRLSKAIEDVTVELMHVIGRLTAYTTKDAQGKPTYIRTMNVHGTGAYVVKTRIPWDQMDIPTDVVPSWIANYISANSTVSEPAEISDNTVETEVEDEQVTENTEIDLSEFIL